MKNKKQKAPKPRGYYARIARELGVSRSHVWRIAHGARKSKRVEAALNNQTKNKQ